MDGTTGDPRADLTRRNDIGQEKLYEQMGIKDINDKNERIDETTRVGDPNRTSHVTDFPGQGYMARRD